MNSRSFLNFCEIYTTKWVYHFYIIGKVRISWYIFHNNSMIGGDFFMKKLFYMFMAFLLLSVPVTGYAAEGNGGDAGSVPDGSGVVYGLAEAADGKMDTYEASANDMTSQKVYPYEKKNIEAIFSAAEQYEKDQLIVSFVAGTTAEEQKSIVSQFGLTVIEAADESGFALVGTAKGSSLKDAASKLSSHEKVEYVEPNAILEKTFTPKDPRYGEQWYLPKINAPKAWDSNKGSPAIVVAVIDEGTQKDHPDLKHSVYKPYNMVNGSTNYTAGDHGTHVSGIIAANFNSIGTSGVAPRTKVMPINVFSGLGADVYTVAKAIRYAADKGAHIINMSLGGTSSPAAVNDAVQYAAKKGVTIVAAAGNDNTSRTMYPAAYKNVIAVSATMANDGKASFSNYGNYVDVSAPGVNILSTTARSRYAAYNGTSMATPIISGTAALILAKNPFLTGAEVEYVLKNSAVDLGSKGKDIYFGNGRVNTARALEKTPAPISNMKAPSSLAANGKGSATVTFNAVKNTTLNVTVVNARGKVVRSLVNNKRWAGGKGSAKWNGKLTNGSLAPTGQYKIVVSLSSSKGKVTASKNITVQSVTPPVVTAPASMYFSPPVKGKLNVPVRHNKKVKVTAKIVDSKNKTVRTIMTGSSTAAGLQNIPWTGLDGRGKKVADGTYRLVVTAVDSAGLSKTVSTKIYLDTKKPEAKVSAGPAVFKADGKNTSKANFRSNESAYLHVSLVSDKGVNVRVLTSNKSWPAGSRTFVWDGKNNKGVPVSSGTYQYVIEVKDRAGNKTIVKSAFFKLQKNM